MGEEREERHVEEAVPDQDEEGTVAKTTDPPAPNVEADDAEADCEPPEKEREQPPVHRRDRRAMFVVALVSALIGLLGVVAGVGATLYLGLRTITADKEQSVEQFRREQRQAEYSDILSQATNLGNATEFAGSDLNILGSMGFGNYSRGGTAVDSSELQQTLGLVPNVNRYNNPQTQYNNGYGSYASPLGSVRGGWQTAYAALDQVIAEAQIAGSSECLSLARALRDKYRNDYAAKVEAQIAALRAVADGIRDQLPPEQRQPVPAPAPLELTVDQVVGVGKPDPAASGYDPKLLEKSARELTEDYVRATKAELELNDE